MTIPVSQSVRGDGGSMIITALPMCRSSSLYSIFAGLKAGKVELNEVLP